MSFFRENLVTEYAGGRWSVIQNRRIFRERVAYSTTGSETLLSVSKHYGVKAEKDLREDEQYASIKPAESLVGYKKVYANDLVMNIMRAQNGSYGISGQNGIVSPAYCVYEPIRDFSTRYVEYLYKTPNMIRAFYANSYGIAEHRRRLYPQNFLNMYTVLPPRAEQDQIVRFLDWKVSGINKMMGAYRREIAMLDEVRQQIIDRSVIRGLHDEELAHNDDIRWDITYPQHWRIQRIRGSFAFRKGLSITKANLEESGIAVISYGQVHSKSNSGTALNDELIRYVNESYLHTNPTCLVDIGDFIFADTSEDVAGCGNVAFVDRKDTIFAGYHTIIAHPLYQSDTKYYAYLFRSPTWRYQIRKKVNGVKVYSITQKILKDAFILVPPDEEQREIVRYLDQQCAQIDAAISKLEEKISKLQELRSRLIVDVVTGAIDVRSVVIPEYEFVETENDSDIEDDDTEEDEEDQED